MQRFPFTTLPRGPLNFSVVMDGANYSAAVSWNIQGQRWFLTLTDRFGVRLTTVAVVEFGAVQEHRIALMERPRAARDGNDERTTWLPARIDRRANDPRRRAGLAQRGLGDERRFADDALVRDRERSGEHFGPGAYGRDIDLTAGYFTTSVLCYRSETFFAYP